MAERWRQPFASSDAVEQRMRKQRSKDTGPELAVRQCLHAMGLRYRVHRRPVPDLRRQADIVFGPARVAVFVDGCFWHGCPDHGRRHHQVNGWYWPEKIDGNRRRDTDTNQRLSDEGWMVVRVWEHEDPEQAAARIAAVVAERRAAAHGGALITARNRPPSPGVGWGMTTGHRISITPTDLHVEVRVAGEKVADTHRAVTLEETGLPTRYYIPREDVRTELLRSTDKATTCPFKGQASYWSVQVGDDVHSDVVWSYEDPIDDAKAIAGLLCFYNERVDLEVEQRS